MKVNTEKITEVLRNLLPAISSSTIVPEHSCFMFYGSKVRASNGELQIITDSGLDTEKPIGVPANHLLKLLSSISEEEVDLVFKEDSLEVRTGRLRGKLVLYIPETFIEQGISFENLKDYSIPNVLDFVKGISFCRLSASEDLTTGPLCGVHIKGNEVYGSDRYRVLRYTLPSVEEDLEYTLPTLFVDTLSKRVEEIISLSLLEDTKSKDMFVVATLKDGTSVTSTLLKGEYRDLSGHFPGSDCKSIKIVLTDELKKVVERQENFLSNVAVVDREICFSRVGDKCVLSVKNKEYGEIEEDCQISSENIEEDIEFKVNPSRIADVISESDILKYYPEKHLLLLGGNNFSCVLATRY